MHSEVKPSGRRRIVRRNHRGTTDTGAGTGESTERGTSSASTISSRNINVDDSVTGNGNEINGEVEQSGLSFAEPRKQDERPGGIGSGRSDNDGGGNADTGTGSTSRTRPNRGDASRRRTEGTPRRIRNRKRQEAQSDVHVKEDEDDIVNIIIAIADGCANATGFQGFQVSDPEARTIARPASRILQRHVAIASVIRTFSDPLALIIAVLTVFGPRYAMWNAMRKGLVPGVQSPIQTDSPSGETTASNGQVHNMKDYRMAAEFSNNYGG